MQYLKVSLGSRFVTQERQRIEGPILNIYEKTGLEANSKTFVYKVIKQQPGSDTITYTDRIKPIAMPSLEKILQKDRIPCYDIAGHRKTVFVPSATERKQILNATKDITKISWEDSLFSNSREISVDSMWSYISNRQKALSFSSNSTNNINNIVSYCSIFQFSKPIFMRNNTIAIFYFMRLCGSSCGVEDLSIYKFQNGTYERWLVIKGADF